MEGGGENSRTIGEIFIALDVFLRLRLFPSFALLREKKACKFTYNNATYINMAQTQQPAVCLFDFVFFMFRFCSSYEQFFCLFYVHFIYRISLFSIYPMMVAASLAFAGGKNERRTWDGKMIEQFRKGRQPKGKSTISLNDCDVNEEYDFIIRIYFVFFPHSRARMFSSLEKVNK